MAFTAVHPDAGQIDATRPDLGCGLEWMQIYRVRPRIALACPECGFSVHAKVSSRGMRYFAHDPGRPPECQISNESIEHHLLKLELATAIRAAGWHAELEVRAEDGSWRADVMASSLDGERRMAWEAQLSPITDLDLLDRTARYADEDIEVCWVSPRDAVPWLGSAPAVRVSEPRGDLGWTVADGLARFDVRDGAWLVVKDTQLERFVRWALEGRVFPHQVLSRYHRIHLSAERTARRGELWTTERSVQAEEQHNAMRERQKAWRVEKERKEREAEKQRLAKEQAEREEQERQRKAEAEARRLEAEERHRLWKIEFDKQQAILEEKRRKAEEERQERERLEAQARAEQVARELEAAKTWWAECSDAQRQELLDAISGYTLKQTGTKAAPEQLEKYEARHAYGIALFSLGKLYGVARPSPASLHRLASDLPIFVRTAHEAEQILTQGVVDADRVTHFNLPDHEQLSLF